MGSDKEDLQRWADLVLDGKPININQTIRQQAARIAELEEAVEAARREGVTGAHDDNNRARVYEFANMVNEARTGGGIIDCTGEVPCVRKVKGTFPITADGVGVLPNAEVYYVFEGLRGVPEVWPVKVIAFDAGSLGYDAGCWYVESVNDGSCFGVEPNRCYSTPEAAKAASEAKHCYPFSAETCQRPECKCRDEKAAAKAAMEGVTRD
jgi:hypothetical protein